MILWRKSWNLITNVTIFGFIGDIRTTKWETWITALLMLISCWRRMWKSSVTVLWIFTPTSARYNTLLSKYQFYFPNKSRCFFSLDELYLQLFFFLLSLPLATVRYRLVHIQIDNSDRSSGEFRKDDVKFFCG